MECKSKVVLEYNGVYQIQIEVDKDFVNRSFDKAYSSVNSRVLIDGFRKGKAPRNIIKKHHFQYVLEEALNDIIYRSIDESSKSLELPSIFDFELKSPNNIFDLFKENEDFSFTIAAHTYPSVTVEKYKDMEIKAKEYFWDETSVDAELDSLRSRESKYEVMETPVEKQDFVKLEYCYFLLDKESHERKEVSVVIGDEKETLNEYHENLIGLKTNDDVEIETAIPIDYEDPELRGRAGKIYIKVLEIKRIVKPELNDEFAKKYEFDSLELFKENIRNQLVKFCEKKTEDYSVELLFDEIAKYSDFKISDKIVEEETNQRFERLKNRLTSMGLDFNTYLKYQSTNIDEIKSSIIAQVNEDYKEYLVYDKIAELEKIEATEADLEEFINKIVEENSADIKEVRKHFSNEKEKEKFFNDHKIKKVQDFLFENNKIDKSERELINSN